MERKSKLGRLLDEVLSDRGSMEAQRFWDNNILSMFEEPQM